jgi:hypothetical protein
VITPAIQGCLCSVLYSASLKVQAGKSSVCLCHFDSLFFLSSEWFEIISPKIFVNSKVGS